MPGLLDYAVAEAQRQGVDPALVQSIMQAEGGQPAAVSPKGAIGPMQLMPRTAAELGVNPADPLDNIRGGVRYLAQLSSRFGGDPRLVAAAYNAGPGAVQRSLAQTGDIPNYPETQKYVQRVVGGAGKSDIDLSKVQWGASPAAAAKAASQGSGGAPQGGDDIDLSKVQWGAAPTSGAATSASASTAEQPGFLARVGRAFVTPPKGIAGIVSPDRNDAGGTLSPGQWAFGPVAGRFAEAAALPVDLADKYIATPLARLVPQALGGNPNTQPFDLRQRIAENTRAPDGAAEAVPSRVAEYLGGAVGGGRLLKAASPLAKILGAPRIAAALSGAGDLTLGNMAGAVTGGAASDLADRTIGQSVSNPVARTAIDVVAGVLGGWPGAALGNRLVNAPADAEAAATLAAARKAGMPVLASDVSPTFEALQRTADKVPLGNLTGAGVPRRQVEAARAALANAAEKYRPEGLDATAGTSGTDTFIANDLRRIAGLKQDANAALYQRAQQALGSAAVLPDDFLAKSATAQAAKNLLTEFPDAFRSFELGASVQGLLKRITGAAKPPEEAVVQLGGKAVKVSDLPPGVQQTLAEAGALPEPPPPLTFDNLRQLRTAVGDMLDQAQSAAGAHSRTKVGALKQLYRALSEDQQQWLATAAPKEARDLYAAADKDFLQNVQPYREVPAIRNVLLNRPRADDADVAADNLYRSLFGGQKGELAEQALSLMSPAGRRAAAYQALKDAADKGLSTPMPTGLKQAAADRALDPERQAALERIVDANPELADDAAQLRALLRIGRRGANAEAKKGAATGIQNVPLLVLGSQAGAGSLLSQFMGPTLGYATAFAGPVAAANVFNVVNRFPRLVLSSPGTVGQRVSPGVLQGLLAPDRNEPLQIPITGGTPVSADELRRRQPQR